MMRNLLLLCSFTLVLSTGTLAGPLKEGTFRGWSDNISITIVWESESEAGVLRYELERKIGLEGSFSPLDVIAPSGDNSRYQYVDEDAFRGMNAANLYQYQLKVVFSNGAPSITYGPITVRHQVSSVRRTWGSIKAMFR